MFSGKTLSLAHLFIVFGGHAINTLSRVRSYDPIYGGITIRVHHGTPVHHHPMHTSLSISWALYLASTEFVIGRLIRVKNHKEC